ncbi:MAG: [protein-PII] uridylyltransferase [Paracoccaceae bacterium]
MARDPDDILDAAALDAALTTALGGSAPRDAAVAALRAARSHGMGAVAEGLGAHPRAARSTTRAYAWLTDVLVAGALRVARTLADGPPPTILAVGGYGRAEMAAHSDVDLLFLTDGPAPQDTCKVIETLLYLLWDLKLKVGHATRSVEECLTLAGEDFTIRTTLVEMRTLSGDAALAATLRQRLWDELFETTARQFVEAKLEERAERHRRQGGQRYVVEPNVKEGKGGLRDLQSLYWMAKYVNGVRDTRELVDIGVFDAAEFATFEQAETFLWAIRCHLHLLAGRAQDQLTFDMQVEVARAMGYVDRAGRRAVELFMHDYFRHATAVGELTRIFVTALEGQHAKPEPLLQRILRRRKTPRAPYAIASNRLTVEDRDAFLADPTNLIRIFEEALRTGTLLHPDAMRLVAANGDRVDEDVRRDPRAIKAFFAILLRHGNPERGLRRMNELGLLGRMVPEFEPIVAMMQFNMYHSYTVDEHTIQTISHLAQIERGELIEELPVASSILEKGVNRKILYTALLLHDTGKGRDEDHSIVGARLARTAAPRLGMRKRDAETVEWLVRHHLLMSDMAQKRDIADPRTVRDFAKAVRTVERLNLLCVLTVCDIRGVGPDTWNNWKAALIRGLYRQTRRALEGGLEDLNRETREAEARANLRAALDGWLEAELRAELARHYPPYWQGLHVTAHADFAQLLRGIGDGEARLRLTPDGDRDATRAVFAMADHPGIFARICAALALVGANVVDARSFTSKDGYFTAAFWIQDGEEGPYDPDRLPRLEAMLHRTLMGEIVASEALASRDKLKARERPFRHPTAVSFDNEGSDIYTIVEVDTRDRPGLLADLARAFASANVSVASAVIATYGAQAVDSFYVKDMFGLKLHGASKRAMLEKRLRDAVAQVAARANA